MYAVIFETQYVTKIVFTGTMPQCKQFLRDNQGVYGDDIFVQELDQCYALLS